MPTYVYACEAGHKFEEYQAITAPSLETCTVYDGGCCTAPAKRLVCAGGVVIFKGSGFHVNDYPKGPAGK